MKEQIILTTGVLLFLSLVSAWGQGRSTIDIDLSDDSHKGGITISQDNSVYRIHGTYDVQNKDGHHKKPDTAQQVRINRKPLSWSPVAYG